VAVETAGGRGERWQGKEEEKKELASVGALIGHNRGFFKLASVARLLLMVAAWPKQRIAEKDVGGGDTAEHAAAGQPL
jgi:hypothetical protein